MDFAWNAATLLALFVGLGVGGGLGYYSAREEAKKKAKGAPSQCPHCGKSLEAPK